MAASRPTTPAQRQLAAAFRRLKTLQDGGAVVFQSQDFAPKQTAPLEKAGFLRRVIKGWYIASRPSNAAGDTTPWFAAMLDFVAGYSNARFGERWHLSPVHSLLVQAGATSLPRHIIVHAPDGANNSIDLPASSSLMLYAAPSFPPPRALTRIGASRVLTVPAALIAAPEHFFQRWPVEAQVALAQIRDASDLSRPLLEGGRSVVAGRLVGALRAVGRTAIADEVFETMRTAGYDVRESNPFDVPLAVLHRSRLKSPHVLRMQLLWQQMRDVVGRAMPADPGLPPSPDAIDAYLADVEATYATDAYHSLSIEGYRVTAALIERVPRGDWSPLTDPHDATAPDAWAALGYYRAFRAVTTALGRIVDGESAASVVAADHGRWYRQLFGASVDANVLAASDLAGYRNGPVCIENATHVPPPAEAVRDMMPAFFELLAAEPNAGVRAVLGHFFFVFIHPYMDGNGRMARLVMNAMLASGGFPWTVISHKHRAAYFAALDAASARSDIGPFARFVAAAIDAPTPPAI
jgi:hypothetical protein